MNPGKKQGRCKTHLQEEVPLQTRGKSTESSRVSALLTQEAVAQSEAADRHTPADEEMDDGQDCHGPVSSGLWVFIHMSLCALCGCETLLITTSCGSQHV